MAMSNNHWHTGIDPKVHRSWNLHQAIKGQDSELEFFLMTSSVSGSVGTASESNYCAGNFFLDMFARHRRAQGLPAQAIGLGMISEVGYVHDNPEIEALSVHKGIQAINEDELLQIVDISLSNKELTVPHPVDHKCQCPRADWSGTFRPHRTSKEGLSGYEHHIPRPTCCCPRSRLG